MGLFVTAMFLNVLCGIIPKYSKITNNREWTWIGLRGGATIHHLRYFDIKLEVEPFKTTLKGFRKPCSTKPTEKQRTLYAIYSVEERSRRANICGEHWTNLSHFFSASFSLLPWFRRRSFWAQMRAENSIWGPTSRLYHQGLDWRGIKAQCFSNSQSWLDLSVAID